jgi:hypothetical protein
MANPAWSAPITIAVAVVVDDFLGNPGGSARPGLAAAAPGQRGTLSITFDEDALEIPADPAEVGAAALVRGTASSPWSATFSLPTGVEHYIGVSGFPHSSLVVRVEDSSLILTGAGDNLEGFGLTFFDPLGLAAQAQSAGMLSELLGGLSSSPALFGSHATWYAVDQAGDGLAGRVIVPEPSAALTFALGALLVRIGIHGRRRH